MLLSSLELRRIRLSLHLALPPRHLPSIDAIFAPRRLHDTSTCSDIALLILTPHHTPATIAASVSAEATSCNAIVGYTLHARNFPSTSTAGSSQRGNDPLSQELKPPAYAAPPKSSSVMLQSRRARAVSVNQSLLASIQSQPAHRPSRRQSQVAVGPTPLQMIRGCQTPTTSISLPTVLLPFPAQRRIQLRLTPSVQRASRPSLQPSTLQPLSLAQYHRTPSLPTSKTIQINERISHLLYPPRCYPIRPTLPCLARLLHPGPFPTLQTQPWTTIP